MKVCMVAPWGRWVRCGIRSYSESLAKALALKGVDVYVARLPRFGILAEGVLQNLVDSIPRDVDLVHVQYEYGLFKNLDVPFFRALSKIGLPVVTTLHSVGDWEKDEAAISTSSKVIVHNRFCYRRLNRREKAVIIPHGCTPVETDPPEECKRRLGIDPRIPIVGYLGFISRYKGLETLIEAMRGVKEAALLIAGGYHVEPGTRYIDRLKEVSLKLLPGRCLWLGYVPDERLSTVYGSFTIEVYPSRLCTESGALITALAHGKAVIASDLPPMREKAKMGALMTFRSVSDLRGKIRKLLSDDALRSRLEEAARRYAESVKWYPNIAEKHIALYREVL
ncbi:hypothetical protein DRO58_06250 [Candidatus Bathyarchaeota archaeon]|nr:MAG: hypothetical protein DRO58_06250 [Candidatus Bathyarchaeota archaeon]